MLDLFCGAGGAADGYAQAGFDVTGVDIAPQPNYPYAFFQGDVFKLAKDWMGTFDLIHASPPCQHFTPFGRIWKDIKERYEDLLAPTRSLLEGLGVPWVIENVPGAPMRVDVELCGSMFGLDAIRRHRWFEVSWDTLMMPPAHNHLPPQRFRTHRGPWADRPLTTRVATIGAWSHPLEDQKTWMGIDRPITVRELSESIPPAYTKWIGEQFLALVPEDR